MELVGTGGGAKNATSATTAAGDAAPIVYMTSNILTSMINPYNSAAALAYQYSGSQYHWVLYADESTGTAIAAGDKVLTRTDASPTLSEVTYASGTPAVASTAQ